MISALTGSHLVGRCLGIAVRISFTLYIMMFLYWLRVASTPILWIPVLLLPVFVFLHEMGHSLAAMKEGVPVRQIVLGWWGGVAQLGGMLPGAPAEIMVALAGPCVSLLLGGLFLIPTLVTGSFYGGGAWSTFDWLFILLGGTNLFLGIFNLLPIFPLDGGRVATALAVMFMGPERGLAAMRKISLIGVACFVLFGLWSIYAGDLIGGVILAGLGIYLYVGGQQEMQARMYASQYMGHRASPGGFGGYGPRQPWEAPAWSADRGWESGGGGVGGQPAKEGWFASWRRKRAEKAALRQATAKKERDQRVDRILAKVNQQGLNSLTPEERRLLHQTSEDYRKQRG